MRAGDIIFVRGTGWLSDEIRKYDPGEFTHVAIATNDSHIFEAQYYMRANIVPMHYTDYEVVPLNLTEKEILKLRVICQALEGKWYDYWQIAGYVFHAWFHLDVSKFNNPNHLICSEALGLILYLLDKIDSPFSNATPNQIYRIVRGGLVP